MFAWQASGLRAAMAATRGPLSSRIAALIAKMTVEEKAGQLTLMPTPWTSTAAAKINPAAALRNVENLMSDAQAGRLGGVFNGFGAEAHRKLQAAAVQGRLGIPLVFAGDVIHGYRTIFPVPLGEAASFDTDLAERTARASAAEMAATGFLHQWWISAAMPDGGARWRGLERTFCCRAIWPGLARKAFKADP
jgi:beta-glucosidase